MPGARMLSNNVHESNRKYLIVFIMVFYAGFKNCFWYSQYLLYTAFHFCLYFA